MKKLLLLLLVVFFVGCSIKKDSDQFQISGYVYISESNPTPIPDVRIMVIDDKFNDTIFTMPDMYGFYQFQVSFLWCGDIKPELDGITFKNVDGNSSYSYHRVAYNFVNQNFYLN